MDSKQSKEKPPSARATACARAVLERVHARFPWGDGRITEIAHLIDEAMAEPAAPPALVYLASPYSHPDPAIREQRFSAACRATTRLIEAGEMVFSPIVHSHPLVEHGAGSDWQTWQHYDRAMIDYCSEVRVLMIAGWVESVGVQAETAYAKEHGKRVTYTCMEALPAQLEDAAPPQLVDEVELLCGNCPGNSVVCKMNPSIVAANEILYICPVCLAQVNVSRAGWTPLPPAPQEAK